MSLTNLQKIQEIINAPKLVVGEKEKDNESEIKLTNATHFLNTPPPPIAFLVENLLPTSNIAFLYGESDCGKSTFAKQLSIDLVAGLEFFCGLRLFPRHRKVFYVSTEDLEEDTHDSLYRQRKRLDGLDVSGLTFAYTKRATDPKFLDKYLSENPTDMVVIDCFSDAASDFEQNNNGAISQFLDPFRDLSQKHNCLFLFIHHTNKAAANAPISKNNMKGSSRMQEKARAAIELKKDPNDYAIRHLCVTKFNRLPDEAKNSAIVLKFDRELLTFSGTGERENFEFIEQQNLETKKEKNRNEVIKIYYECKGLGKEPSFSKIAELAGEKGINISKTTAYRFVREHEEELAKNEQKQAAKDLKKIKK